MTIRQVLCPGLLLLVVLPLPATAQTFRVPTVISAPVHPNAVAVADFNGDGALDLAVPSYSPNTLAIYLGDGAGGFTPGMSYIAGAGPRFAAIADINSDGRKDVLVVSQDSGDVTPFLGAGDGTFAKQSRIPVGTLPFHIAPADFDRNGHADFVVSNSGTNSLSILLGSGAGTFTTVNVPAGASPHAAAVADFNGDGRPDVAVSNYGSADVSILLGDGNGGFSPAGLLPSGTNPFTLAAGELNGDGRVDLAVPNFGAGTIGLYFGDGSGGFSAPTVIAVGKSPRAVTIADLNGDSLKDLAVMNRDSNTITVLRGNGAGAFAAAGTVASGSGPFMSVAADANSDGLVDLIVADRDGPSVSVLLGAPAGDFASPRSYPVGTGPRGIVAADLNADGVTDFVTANNATNTVSVVLGQGNGAYAPGVTYPVRQGPYGGRVADLNGDGHMDIVVAASSANRASVLYGNGTGAFGAAVSYTSGSGPRAVTTGDINRDGKPDLITANFGANTVSVLLRTADGFGVPTAIAVGVAPTDVQAADFNGDSLPDLAVANSGSGNVAILLAQGSSFAPAVFVAAGATPSALATSDMDGDGDVDVVVANETANTVSLLRNDGPAGFVLGATLTVGTRPLGVAVADMTGDGQMDIISANAASNTLSVLRGRSDGTFKPAVSVNAGVFSRALSIADMDGDSQPDIAVANANGNDAWLILNRTGAVQDLAVAIADATSAVRRGDTVSYTVTLTNGGPTVLTGVRVSLSPGSALENVTAVPSAGSYDVVSGDWDGLNVPSGGAVTLQVNGVVAATATGTITVTAAAAARGAVDPVLGNNAAADSNAVIAGDADLAVAITDGKTTVSAGETVTYSVVITNAGPSAVGAATVNLSLPTSVTQASWTCAGTAGATCGSSGTGAVQDVVSLPAGSTATYTLQLSINTLAVDGRFVVTASVAAPADIIDPNGSDNTVVDDNKLNGRHKPVALGQAVATDEDSPVAVTLNGTDEDGDALVYTVVGAPAHGSLTGTAPNLVYAPHANYAGPDSFTFKVNDGTFDSETVTVTLSVASQNDAPVAVAGTGTTDEDVPVSLLLAGSDPDGDALTYSIVRGPAHGALSGAGATRTYTPAANFHGADDLVFNVSDGKTVSQNVTVTLTVRSVNDQPVVAAPLPDLAVTGDATTATVDVASVFADIESGLSELSMTATSSDPALVAPSLSGTTLTLTLAANRGGRATVTVVATDPSGASGRESFDVTVTRTGARITVSDANRGEGSTTGVVFTVALSMASDTAVSVNYATVNGTANADDYTAATGTLTFAPGVTSRTLRIATTADVLDEDDETFSLVLTAPVGAGLDDAEGVGTILDNDTATVTMDDITIVEGDSGTRDAVFTVRLSNPSVREITATYTTTAGNAVSGADYTAVSGVVTFPAGSTEARLVNVPVIGDINDEPTETLSLVLSNVANATVGRGTARANITDDDAPPSVTVSNVTMQEGQSGTRTFVFTLTLSASSAFTTRLHYDTADGTATAGSDYVARSGDVIFAAGTTQQTIAIVVNGDTTPEGAETFLLNLSVPVNLTIATPQVQGTILDDDGV